jgi:aryl-alcohol dehydrogenase
MNIDAALAHANASPLNIEAVELAAPSAGEVLIRISASGLCHTDLHMLDHAPLPWPALLGHEGAGVIEAVGADVTHLKVGEHVVLTTASCGICKNCLAGSPSFCVNFQAVNLSGGHRADGSCTHTQNGRPVFAGFLGQSSFATHALVGHRSVVPVASDLPLDSLAPLGCGVQTGAGAVLNTLRPRPGSSLAVFGAGAVGLSAILAARISGCGPIVAVDRLEGRLDLAKELGATHVVNAANEDAVAGVQAATGGGADYSVEAVGSTAVMRQAIEALGSGGVAVLVGVATGGEVSISPTLLQAKNITVRGSLMAGEGAVPQLFLPQLIRYWQEGRFPFDRMLRFYDFAEINTAIEEMRAGTAIKPVLRIARI